MIHLFHAIGLLLLLLLLLQSYDQPQRIRKFLLQSKPKNDQQPIMVEPPPFDIYLCDNCDAELYSEEAMLVCKHIYLWNNPL